MVYIAFPLLGLIAFASAALVLMAVQDAKSRIRADVAALSNMQQRRYDDLLGLVERIEALQKPAYVLDTRTNSISEMPKRKGPPVIHDFETSQQAALEEFEPKGNPV